MLEFDYIHSISVATPIICYLPRCPGGYVRRVFYYYGTILMVLWSLGLPDSTCASVDPRSRQGPKFIPGMSQRQCFVMTMLPTSTTISSL